jgi:hypothetical protein
VGSVDPFGVAETKMKIVEEVEDMSFESETEFSIKERSETIRSKAGNWVHLEESIFYFFLRERGIQGVKR